MSETELIKNSDIHAKRRERQVLNLGDFTDADIAAVEAARSPEAAKAFNSELK